ncbi:MAG: SurA N-terminal domain-containing protein [Chlamydiales bacterium]|nr:SurA N-terminal domain-containing protein [Chlamydiales bacterium]
MLKKSLLALFVLGASLSSQAVEPLGMPTSYEEPQHLVINNRILAKINGKTISVVDVVKKMDVFLNRAYPQYASSKAARYQFYTTQWRNTLSQMIDNELMLADAETIELKVSDGEVRESLQERFGPNVMANLESIGITYEEAREMIHAEIVVSRMQWFKINSKAILSVSPQDIKAAYKEFCQKNPPAEEWKYQVLSIRAVDSALLAPLTQKAEALLNTPDTSLQTVYEKISTEEGVDPSITLTLSPPYEVADKSLSASHRETLSKLVPGAISAPLAQPSKDGSLVYRIFHLKDHIKKEPPPFEKVSDTLFEELAGKAADRETAQYLAKLRQKFSFEEKHFQESLPADFQPFALK